jgi:hypothetical protein
MKPKRDFVVRLGLFAACICLLAGCGGSSNRKPLTGSIQGESRNGTLVLVPAPGVSGPTAQTEIVSGKFRFDTTNGPATGQHIARVQLEPVAPVTRTQNSKEVPLEPTGLAANPLGIEEFEVQVTIPESAPYQVDITPPVRQ